jgi:rubrerythrin
MKQGRGGDVDRRLAEILEGLKKAIQAEKTGQEFYKMAARTTADPKGKKVFEELAAEEAEHFDYLVAHYQALKSSGKVASKKLTLHADLAANEPIFSADLKKRIKEAHFEMSALAIAVQLELNALVHYREQAAKAKDPAVRELFEELVKWETGHYEAFIRQQQVLQEEYWSEAGFAPF